MVEKAKVRSSRYLNLGIIRGDTYLFEKPGNELVVPLTKQVEPYIYNGPLEIVEMIETEETTRDGTDGGENDVVEAQPSQTEETSEKEEESSEEGGKAEAHQELKKNFTKKELKEYADYYEDLELDQRQRKDDMIGELLEELGDVREVFEKYLS